MDRAACSECNLARYRCPQLSALFALVIELRSWNESRFVHVDDSATLAIEALDGLDLGVLMYAHSIDRVLLANETARRLFDELDMHALHAALREAIAGSHAVRLALPTGRRVFVRTRRLRDGWLVTLRTEVLREDDLFDVLRRRFALSVRECQVIALVRVGHSNEHIGRELGISGGTVKQYLNRVFKTFDVHSRGELVAMVERIAREQLTP